MKGEPFVSLCLHAGDMSGTLVAPANQRPDSRYWGLDPLFSAHVKLLGTHLALLPNAAPAGDVVWLSNHPIRFVDVMGIVISVDPKRPLVGTDRRVSFTLDDGSSSGLVDCVFWFHDLPEAQQRQAIGQVRLGALLHVLGKLGVFRQTRQVTVERCWAESDPMGECLHWVRARELWQTVYSRKFRIPENARSWMAAGTGNGGASASERGRAEAPADAGAAQMPAVDEGLRDAVRTLVLDATYPDVGLSLSGIVSRLRASGLVQGAGAPMARLRDAVGLALRQLEEASVVYMDGDERGSNGESALWRVTERRV
jgi:hypothetical protein